MPRQPQSRRSAYHYDKLEQRNLLANDVLPDVFAWASEERGYLYDYVVEGDLLRFTTAFANQGEGHLEVFGGDPTESGNQEVFQRIYDDEGGYRDRLAGEFTYHPSHGHIHFDGYAIYNLREIGPAGEVGDIVATGGKVSFCLIDITRYDPEAGSSNYGGCGTTQGVSAGWSDVYGRGLPDQWINISGVDDGDYYLEVVTDPEDQLLESDETNNSTIITVTIEGGPGNNGDRLEPNNSFVNANNLGVLSYREEPGLSIHTENDVDYYQFSAVDHGDFEIHVEFSHELGDLNAYVYDEDFNLVASGESTTDLEDLHFHTHPDLAYFLKIEGVDGATNGYDLVFNGPGDLVTITVDSDDVPISIPDGIGGSNPGDTVTSTLQGPDVTLTDVNLLFHELRHTYLGDLSISLTSPSGTTAQILRSNWESDSGPLGSEDDFINTVLDDQAPTNIDDGTAPFTGSFNVNYGNISDPLSAFNGENALGTWTVAITDWYSADTGTLHDWGIMFSGIDNNAGDELEHNDDFPQATDLGTIGTYTHAGLSIHKSTDVDFFRFNAQDSTHVQIDLTFPVDEGNLDVVVYDSNQQEIARADTINDDESLRLAVEAGELYYIKVYGYEYGTNDYDLSIDVPELVGESGTIGLVSGWQKVELDNHYDNPVIMITSPTSNDSTAVNVNMGRIDSDSFWVRLNSWDSTDPHGAESLGYFVVEAGTHTLRDGTVISAGQYRTTNTDFIDVEFDSAFEATPVVFGQLLSRYESATLRMDSVDPNGFRWSTQLNEATNDSTVTRHLGHWLAILPGSGSTEYGNFEAGRVSMNHQAKTIDFNQSFATTPNALLGMQSFNGGDSANVRMLSRTSSSLTARVQEETSLDKETNHTTETVGYFAFATGEFYAAEPGSNKAPSAFVPGVDPQPKGDQEMFVLPAITSWETKPEFEWVDSSRLMTQAQLPKMVLSGQYPKSQQPQAIQLNSFDRVSSEKAADAKRLDDLFSEEFDLLGSLV